MRHVRPEADDVRAVDHVQCLDHSLPAVHAAPADFTLRREALAKSVHQIAGFAKGSRDQSRIVGQNLRPGVDPAGRIDAHNAGLANSEVAQLLADAAGLADNLDEALAVFRVAHRETAANEWPDRRDK